ncbi:hypothetical protein BVC80_8335g2 [Macleaya cordata]|uniref:C2HC zinc finger plants domain-containing protein n=1 Tax=Macleaya cordata TaxID=56857 RepID=A0A200R8F8_MACCD|nr:hypothetical protein BVC80_8335g2 [Macleaya cordata]
METSSTDMEMEMEMEMESSSAMNHHHHNNNNEDMKSLLTMARQLINQGRPSLALQAVVAAVKSDGGDQAVFQTLHRARELYRNKLQTNAAADELASLFAECAIAEAKPLTLTLTSEQSPTYTGDPPGTVTPDANGTSILAKTGRKQIMLDAFSDGSSFVCLQCGGLVSNHRKEEHLAYWCC